FSSRRRHTRWPRDWSSDVCSSDLELMALAVDEFVGEQEIVLKSMSTFTGRLNGIAGATILADGSVALVVDIGALIEYQTRRRREIGRASCRERVEISVGAASVRKK